VPAVMLVYWNFGEFKNIYGHFFGTRGETYRKEPQV
jgi:hypothetical protein